MADFDVNTITAAGATLIASATAGNKLVIDGCDATTDVLTKAQAVQVSTRPASPGSNTTDVALAGSTDNHVYAYAEFIRGQSTGGDFNSFFLYGHIENAPSVIRVIAVASATAATHLPESGDVTNRTELQFELTFSATDEVVTVADSSMYATRGEVQVLRERVVTTHAEGSATTGEAQSIYGQKTFKDALVVEGDFTPDLINFSSLSGYVAKITGNADDSLTYPSAGVQVASGAASGLQARINIHMDHLTSKDVGSVSLTFSGGQSVGGFSVEYDSSTYDQDHPNRAWTFRAYCGSSMTTYDGEKLTIDGSIIPRTDDKYTLGSGNNEFSEVHAKKLYLAHTTRTIAINGDDQIEVDGDIVPDMSASYSLGSTGYIWDCVFASSFVGSLDGLIPYPTSTTAEPPVGSIVFIWINVGTSLANVELMPGQEVHAQGVGDLYYQQVSPASFSDGSMYRAGSSPWILYTGKYRLLSGAKPTGSQGDICYALAIRIE